MLTASNSADSLAENTPNVTKFISPIFLLNPKGLGYHWKKASRGVLSPWACPPRFEILSGGPFWVYAICWTGNPVALAKNPFFLRISRREHSLTDKVQCNHQFAMEIGTGSCKIFDVFPNRATAKMGSNIFWIYIFSLEVSYHFFPLDWFLSSC